MRAGLPAVTTLGPEITRDIKDREAGWTLPIGQVEALASALHAASVESGERERRGANARALFQEKYTIEASLAPLFPWVENPQVAPDHGLWPLLVPPPVAEERGLGARIRRRLFGKT